MEPAVIQVSIGPLLMAGIPIITAVKMRNKLLATRCRSSLCMDMSSKTDE
jgi:hypothetical protein